MFNKEMLNMERLIESIVTNYRMRHECELYVKKRYDWKKKIAT